MSSIGNITNVITTTLKVNNTLKAPSITLGEILVNNGTNVAYQSVGTDDYLLQANSSASTGISYIAPTGGTGGGNVKMTIATSCDMGGATKYLSFNPWSDTGNPDSITIPFDSSQLTYLQIFPCGSENWAFSTATALDINIGTINSSGTFVAASGTTPHISLDSATYHGTGIVYQSDVSGNSWSFDAGDNFTMSFTWVGSGGGVAIGVLATFEGDFE